LASDLSSKRVGLDGGLQRLPRPIPTRRDLREIAHSLSWYPEAKGFRCLLMGGDQTLRWSDRQACPARCEVEGAQKIHLQNIVVRQSFCAFCTGCLKYEPARNDGSHDYESEDFSGISHEITPMYSLVSISRNIVDAVFRTEILPYQPFMLA